VLLSRHFASQKLIIFQDAVEPLETWKGCKKEEENGLTST